MSKFWTSNLKLLFHKISKGKTWKNFQEEEIVRKKIYFYFEKSSDNSSRFFILANIL